MVDEILNQIELVNGKVKSKSTGNIYEVDEFIKRISVSMKLTKSQRRELESFLTTKLKPQSEASVFTQSIIEKYEFEFSDGVYILRGEVKTIDEIYRIMWCEEKLLPSEVDPIVENIEKISQPMDLQDRIYEKIVAKSVEGKSEYLESLDRIYPNINFRNILYNILVPNTKPLFHIFYDDGVGGTGKSTLLEVITKIVGENFTSNVLLDQFGNRFIFSNMLGKYVNVGDDNGKNEELQNVGTLKSIITGNRVTIDRKNISPIEVRIFAKQLFATNILPYIDFTDGGIMRRLNIVPMNKVIPKEEKLCELDENEIGKIIYEVLSSKDLEEGENELAIISSPLYRFYSTSKNVSYDAYKTFCFEYGFRAMNILNFEVKSKFIKSFLDRKQKEFPQAKPIKDDEIPF